MRTSSSTSSTRSSSVEETAVTRSSSVRCWEDSAPTSRRAGRCRMSATRFGSHASWRSLHERHHSRWWNARGQGLAAVAEDAAASGISVARRPQVRDATAIARAVRDRSVSAVELAREHLERAAADQLGAVWLVTHKRALDEAAAVDAALAAGVEVGPLAGVPVGWKDLIDTAGIRTTYGSAIYRDHVPSRDADVVAMFAAV